MPLCARRDDGDLAWGGEMSNIFGPGRPEVAGGGAVLSTSLRAPKSPSGVSMEGAPRVRAFTML